MRNRDHDPFDTTKTGAVAHNQVNPTYSAVPVLPLTPFPALFQDATQDTSFSGLFFKVSFWLPGGGGYRRKSKEFGRLVKNNTTDLGMIMVTFSICFHGRDGKN